MPEHVHLLVTELPHATPSIVLHKLKLRVARQMRKPNQPEGASPPPLDVAGPLSAFWQPRVHDFNVYTEGKRTEKLRYMHANPIQRRPANHPKDWPWSSWSWYEKGEAGFIRVDVAD